MEIFTLLTGLAYVILEIRQKNAMWVLGILTALASMFVFFSQGLYAFGGLQVYYFLVSFWGLYRWRKDRRALERSRIKCGMTGKVHVMTKRECGMTTKSEGRDAGKAFGMTRQECWMTGKEHGVTGNVVLDDRKGVLDGQEERRDAGEVISDSRADVIHLNRLNGNVLFVSVLVGTAAFVGTAFLMMRLDDPMPWLDSAVTVLGAVATWWLGRSYKEQWWLLIVANVLTVLMFVLQGSWWMTALYVVYVAASVYGLVHWSRSGVYIEKDPASSAG